MTESTDNETWLIDAGDEVIRKRTGDGELTLRDQLIYCLWVADYGMRNAGTLAESRELYPYFREEAYALANDLGLAVTAETFALLPTRLEAVYFERFDRMCNEIRNG